jgi:hypothetical protein
MKSLDEAMKLKESVDRIKAVTQAVSDTTYMWINDYVGNFEEMTNETVVKELNRRFSGNGLRWIKQQYAMNHLALMLRSDGIETAQNALSVAAAFDPTGVAGVVDAFAKPICKRAQDFPEVSLLSQTPAMPYNR